MKGENPYFYPQIAYSLVEGDEDKLDLRTKKPMNVEGMGQVANPLLTVDEGGQTLYNNDLDRWLLNN